MSAVTVAMLDNLRAEVTATALSTSCGRDYGDALGTAPALVAIGHLLRVAARVVALAAHVAVGRRDQSPRLCTPGHCDRCVPGPRGEHIDVRLIGQLPCEHTGGLRP